MAALIFFAILALLALISGILLGLRAGADKKLEHQISQGIYEVMDCMCIQTDHRVDGHAVSLIRIRTSSGQECADWFRAPRSLARRFDGWREYYVFQV